MSRSDLSPMTAWSARLAGGGPSSDLALGPSPRPLSPWHWMQRSRNTTAPRWSDGGVAGRGSTTFGPPAAAVIRATRLSVTRLTASGRSEEHTSELQSPYDLGCRL